MKDEETTDVIFRMLGDECIALFPGLLGTNNPATCENYMHIGQHSAGTAEPLGRLAKPAEYASLKRELESAPYRYKLRIRTRFTRAHYLQRLAQVHK